MYFDGHFVFIESGSATKVPFVERALDHHLAPGPEEIGDGARVDDRHGLGSLDVAQREVQPVAARISGHRAHDGAAEDDEPECDASSLGWSAGFAPPARLV